jgi:predicted NAD/FAD-binding protein
VRVVIIGAGAAGVFTAYRLHERSAGAYEIVLIEKTDRVGGNASSTSLSFGGASYSIDCGAQFFYKNPQPAYVKLLGDLGLFDEPAEIQARATGITIWDRQAGKRRLWIPAHLEGFLRYHPEDWARMIGFATFLVYAFLLDRGPDDNWTLSVDEWIGQLTLLDDEFKQNVLRPFLYQFVTLPADRIGEASARYAVTYFVRNVFGEPGLTEPDPNVPAPPGAPTFEVYQSRIGLDGILERTLEAAGVVARLNEPVTSVSRNGDGTLQVTTSADVLTADHVVFATDPNIAAAILDAGSFPASDLISALESCEYGDLQISMQNGTPCWMPADTHIWESVNTVVDGDLLAFSVWFGPLRDRYDGAHQIPVFKSWASPNLMPASCTDTFLSHTHRILLPTTTFMAARANALAHQGEDHVWFAGGWTNWFDSQEAALDSATDVAARLGGAPLDGLAHPQKRAHDSDRQRDRIRRWLARIAAHSPAEHRNTLLTLIDKVESSG